MKAETQKKSSRTFDANRLLYLAFAPAYVFGAKKQIVRYKETARLLKSQPVLAVTECLHEASNLVEDLSMIYWYLKLAGIEIVQDESWRDVRHHLRHDIREELNRTIKLKRERAIRLKINDKLITEFSFNDDWIMVGKTKIDLHKVEEYLEKVANKLYDVFEDGVKKGFLSSNPLTKET